MNVFKEFGIKKVIIHGGISKTGSTALQHILEKSYYDLLDINVLYPKSILFYEPLRENRSSGHFLQLIVDNERKFNTKISSEIKLLNHDIDTVIISTENLYEFLKSKKNVNKINEIFSDIDVELVIYLRNQIDWIESQYREDIIGSWRKTNVDIKNYLNEYLPVNLNYYEMLGEIEEKISPSKISVLNYDVEKKDIMKSFQLVTGLNFDYDNYDFNTSVDTSTIILFKTLNKLNFNGVYKNVIRKYFSEYYIPKKDNYTLIDEGFREEILSKYNISNEMLGIQYFHDSDLYKYYNTGKEYYKNGNLAIDIQSIESMYDVINDVYGIYPLNNSQKVVYEYIENSEISSLMRLVHKVQHSKLYKMFRPLFIWMKK